MYPIHSHILAATTNTKKVNKIVNWFSIFVFYSILHFVQFQATNAIEMYALCSRSWFMASVCGLIFDMKQSDHRDSIPFLIGRLLRIETHNVFFFKKNTIRCIHRFLGSHRRSTTINFFSSFARFRSSKVLWLYYYFMKCFAFSLLSATSVRRKKNKNTWWVYRMTRARSSRCSMSAL